MKRPIDKSACLVKIGTPKLDPESGLLYVQQVKYVVTTEIRIICHRRLLLLHYILRENAMRGNFHPDYTIVQATDDYVTYDHRPEAKTRWRTCMYDRLERRYDFDVDCAFYSHSDELRVNRFCQKHSQNEERTGFRALYVLQNTIRLARELRKRKTRERKIIQRMKEIRPVGKRFEGWAFHDALPKYIFYDYGKGKKYVKGFCTGCCETVNVAAAKHNKPVICPNCGVAASFKCRAKSQKLFDRETAQILQRVSDRELILRIFKLSGSYSTVFPQYEIHESARFFITWDESGKMTSENYYNSYDSSVLTSWRSGERPVILGHFETYESGCTGHLFTRDLAKTLVGTPWQYSQLDRLYLSLRKPLDVCAFLKEFHRVPFVEYLVKLNLTNLASDAIYRNHSYGSYSSDKPAVVNECGKNLNEILGVTKADVPLLQAINPTNIQLSFVQDMKQIGIKPDSDLLKWCGLYNITSLKDILVPLRYMTPHKLMRYVEEQFASHFRRYREWNKKGYTALKAALSSYRDYLEMCEKLSFDMKNTMILFPRDLLDTHDNTVVLLNQKKMEGYEREIMEAYPECVERYAYEDSDLMIVPPKTSRDIVEEGQALHHCVSNYIERVANKECVILFLRKTSEPTVPFCTLEVRGNELIQARGEWNHDPTKEALRFLDVWKRNVLDVQREGSNLMKAA